MLSSVNSFEYYNMIGTHITLDTMLTISDVLWEFIGILQELDLGMQSALRSFAELGKDFGQFANNVPVKCFSRQKVRYHVTDSNAFHFTMNSRE